jgi:hypothetical protein
MQKEDGMPLSPRELRALDQIERGLAPTTPH